MSPLIGIFGDLSVIKDHETTHVDLNLDEGIATIECPEWKLKIRYTLAMSAFFARLQLLLEISPFMIRNILKADGDTTSLGYDAWLKNLTSLDPTEATVGFSLKSWTRDVKQILCRLVHSAKKKHERKAVDDLPILVRQYFNIVGKLAMLTKIANEQAQLALLYNDEHEMLRGFERLVEYDKANHWYLLARFIGLIKKNK